MQRLQENINVLAAAENLSVADFLGKMGIDNDIDALSATDIFKLSENTSYSADELLKKDLNFKQIAAKADIKLLILDIDGVMTDAGMYFTENGDQMKKYNAKDGMAIIHLTRSNFQVGVISSGFTANMVKQRIDMLKIQNFYVGRDPKMGILKNWLEKLNLDIKNVAFIGDDINDLEIMQQCGLAICPNNAVPAIKNIAHIILKLSGGDGCVREYIDDYLIPNIDLDTVAF